MPAQTTGHPCAELLSRFTALSKEWTAHCQKTSTSSQIEDALQHPSFRGLIALGPPALPLIMERYRTDELCPWEFVVEEITRIKFIENRNEIIWGEVTKKRLAWWEKERVTKQ